MDIDVTPMFDGHAAAIDEALALAWPGLRATPPADAGLFAYFRALGVALDALDGPMAATTRTEALRHLDYLAEKSGCPVEAILDGALFCTAAPVVLDTLTNVSAVLRAHQPLTAAPAAAAEIVAPAVIEPEPDDIETVIAAAEARLQGWCSRDKALCIADMILAEKPLLCVEIGIFGGRSLVPAAAALRRNGTGVIYGIEAWDAAIAVETATNQSNDAWWGSIDFVPLKREFLRFVTDMDLVGQVRIIEASSSRAATLFDSIDYLHIDGSHSTLNAAEDVLLYARKVRPGGIILFDDIDWTTTGPALALLRSFCDIERMLKNPASGQDGCAVLRRRPH